MVQIANLASAFRIVSMISATHEVKNTMYNINDTFILMIILITFIQDEEKDNMTECEEAGLLEGLWQLLTGSQEGEI